MQTEVRHYPPKSTQWADGQKMRFQSRKKQHVNQTQNSFEQEEGVIYTLTEKTLKKYTHKDVIAAVRNIMSMRGDQFQIHFADKVLQKAAEYLTLVELNDLTAKIIREHNSNIVKIKPAQ